MAEAAARITGKPALCIGTLGPGVANMPAIQCAKVENEPVIFLGGQRARVTERRVRRGRIQFVRQEPMIEDSVKYCSSIEYADQTDEIIREAIRVAMSGTPGPCLHRISRPRDPRRARRAGAACRPRSYRLINQGADGDRDRRGGRADQGGQEPDPAGRPRRPHVAQSGEKVKELAT